MSPGRHFMDGHVSFVTVEPGPIHASCSVPEIRWTATDFFRGQPMNPRSFFRNAPLYLLVVVTLISPRLFAQATATGNIQGTIVDQSQAVVTGAEVVLTNPATGTTRSTTTNDAGVYRFELLPAGSYTAKINARGFQTVELKLDLLVGQTSTGNVTLTPGAASQTVQVTAQNPIVDLNKTSVSTDITPAEVQNLPMVGRDVA